MPDLLRKVGVSEYGQSVGIKRKDLGDRILEMGRRLMRKSIHEVDIEAHDPYLAQFVCSLLREIKGLPAIYTPLHVWMTVLDAKTSPIDPQVGQHCDLFTSQISWIDLDGELCVCSKFKCSFQVFSKAIKIVWLQYRWCAAAQMNMRHRMAATDAARNQIDFAFQKIKIIPYRSIMIDYARVATAEPAQTATEGNMEIE